MSFIKTIKEWSERIQLYPSLLEEKNRIQVERDSYAQNVKELQESIKIGSISTAQMEQKIMQLENAHALVELEKKMLAKYPPAKVTWHGRTFPNSTEQISFPVNCLITPYDPFIISDLIDWKLYNTGEYYETLIPKIYTKIKEKYYKYAVDKKIWGKNEVWEFPFEMRAKGFKDGFDCDSWAQFQISYYLAAGVPYILVRGVCGDTLIEAHSTVYVYSMKTGKWHHLNSTYSFFPPMANVSQYLTTDHAKMGDDRIGISKVYFSYDLKRCYYDFENPVELEGFKIMP